MNSGRGQIDYNSVDGAGKALPLRKSVDSSSDLLASVFKLWPV